jgi:hypothetical protein
LLGRWVIERNIVKIASCCKNGGAAWNASNYILKEGLASFN